MDLEYPIPSKTYLMGEYAVMRGCPALGVATAPPFIVRVSTRFEKSLNDDRNPWPVLSPAGRLWAEKHPLLTEKKIDFIDSHSGAGGFGASSAQFLATHLAMMTTIGHDAKLHRPLPFTSSELKELWQDFVNKSNFGSGGDLVIQSVGECVGFNLETFSVRSTAWPLADIGVFLVRSGKKIATHVHLSEVRYNTFASLNDLCERTSDLFFSGDVNGFFDGLREFDDWRVSEGLWREDSVKLCQEIFAGANVRYVRGCGALGVDVMAVFFGSSSEIEVRQRLRHMNLEIVASHQDLAPGGLTGNFGSSSVSVA